MAILLTQAPASRWLATLCCFSPNINLECGGRISITRRLVLVNWVFGVLPSAAVVEEVAAAAAGRLKSFRLENPDIRRNVAIVWPKNRVTADGLWAVTRIIRQRTAELVRQGHWPNAILHTASEEVSVSP